MLPKTTNASQQAEDLRRAQVRNALALLLDRKLPADDALSLMAWEAVQEQTQRSRDWPALASVTVVPSGCDRLHRVLHTVASSVIMAPNWTATVSRSDVVALPCPALSTVAPTESIAAFVGAGGVLITSGRAIERAALHAWLPSAGRLSPRRVRVRRTNLPEEQSLLPAVYIDGGSPRIDPEVLSRPGVQTLAVDAVTDEPLVVLAPAERGYILHSVPHWFQPNTGWFTELERGRVAANPWVAERWPGAQQQLLGDLLAADVMYGLLHEGMKAVQARTLRHANSTEGSW